MKKITNTLLFAAIICCAGFAFTACDKDKDESKTFSGTVTFDTHSSSFQSAYYLNWEEGPESEFVATLLPSTNFSDEDALGAVNILLGNVPQNTPVDLTQFDENITVRILFNTMVNGKPEIFAMMKDSDSSNKYYILGTITGNDLASGNAFKVTKGSFSYSAKGSELSFSLNVESEDGHTMTLNANGLGKMIEYQE